MKCLQIQKMASHADSRTRKDKMYPADTALVIRAAFGGDEFASCEQSKKDGFRFHWNHPTEPQPTEQQVTEWATDATPLPSGELFSEWQAENGGDEKKTRKRRIREAFKDAVDNGDVDKVAIRAVIDVVATLTNTPRSEVRQGVLARMIEIIDQG